MEVLIGSVCLMFSFLFMTRDKSKGKEYGSSWVCRMMPVTSLAAGSNFQVMEETNGGI